MLQCSADSYPPASLTYINKDKASRHIAGKYICVAENEVARQQLIMTVRVLCKVNLYHFSFFTKGNETL